MDLWVTNNMSDTISVTRRRRGIFGKIIKLAFYLFQAFAVVVVVMFFQMPSQINPQTVAEKAGTIVGMGIAGTVTVVAWMIITLFLGLLVLATRGKIVTTTQRRERR
jgi:hypothetical protein